MPPTTQRSYKVKKSDSALTLPGRVTFPQGSYVSSPTPNNVFAPAVNAGGYGGPQRTPYSMNAGTGVSGLSGFQGAQSAMYPTTSNSGVMDRYQYQQGMAYNAQNNPMRGRSFNSTSTPPPVSSVGSFTSPGGANVADQYPWLAGTQPTTTPAGGGADLSQGGIPGANGRVLGARDALGNAAPYGLNSYGERLTSSGDVWNPTTATTDIYGGRFIQPGETRWERIGGKLKKVQYGKNGQKKVVSGGKNQSNNQRQDTRAPQQARQQEQADGASMFVSFRS